MLSKLNSPQREAVKYLDGPLLVLAGAGSGKTRVITHKIVHLIDQCGYQPREIAAITFTNKAAREMQERVSHLLKDKPVEGKAETGNEAEGDTALLEKLKTLLADSVETVRYSSRLVESPACIVVSETDPGFQMRRLLEAAGQAMPAGKPIFELNARHALVKRLAGTDDEAAFGDLAHVLLDEARLSAGLVLENPSRFVARVNRLLG